VSNKNRDLRQSVGWGKYLQHLGWSVEEIKNKKPGIKIYIKKIPFLGAVIKIQRPAEIPPIEEIDRIAKKHRALFVKIEPVGNAQSAFRREGGFSSQEPVAGFEPDPTPNLPTRTIQVDLSKTEEELWKNLSQDARQSVRKAQSYKLQVASFKWGEPGFEKALNEFHRLLKETGHRQKFWTGDYAQLKAKADAFQKDCLVFLVFPNKSINQPIAGALVLLTGDTASFRKETSRSLEGTAFYHHTASNETGRKLFAPYILMWEIIKEIKGRKPGIGHLEFEGIVDPRFPQTKRWEGFTVFKRKWGGDEIEFPAPLIKHYHPLVKAFFALSRKIAVG